MKKIETILGHAPWRLEAWVDENQANRLTIGAKARFIAPGLPGKMNAKVVSIDQDTTRELPDGQLSAQHGGHILVREQKGKWIPEQAVYRVSLELDQAYTHDLMATQRGLLFIDAQAHSLAGEYLRHALAVLIREFKP